MAAVQGFIQSFLLAALVLVIAIRLGVNVGATHDAGRAPPPPAPLHGGATTALL